MDRKVFIIRTWLLLISLGGLTLAWPSVGVGVWPMLGMMISTYKCCCGCSCEYCADPGTAACEYQVEIAGMADAGCLTCDTDFNATFILEKSTSAECLWIYPTLNACSAINSLQLNIYEVGGDYRISVCIFGALFGATCVATNGAWFKSFGGTKPTCATLSGEVLTLNSSVGTCTFTGSTATVTAVP